MGAGGSAASVRKNGTRVKLVALATWRKSFGSATSPALWLRWPIGGGRGNQRLSTATRPGNLVLGGRGLRPGNGGEEHSRQAGAPAGCYRPLPTGNTAGNPISAPVSRPVRVNSRASRSAPKL